MTTLKFMNYLKSLHPTLPFKNGTIDKSSKTCIGVYTRLRTKPFVAIGGVQATSYGVLSVTILVHWTENSNTCEEIADSIYESLFCKSDILFEGSNIRSIELLDNGSIDVGRDDKNICERVIRANIFYERG